MHQQFKPWVVSENPSHATKQWKSCFEDLWKKCCTTKNGFTKKTSYALVGPAETFRASQKQIASRVHWLDSAPDMEWITETPLVFFRENMMTI